MSSYQSHSELHRSINHKNLARVLALALIAFYTLPCLAWQNSQVSNVNMAVGFNDSIANSNPDAQLDMLSRRLALNQDQKGRIRTVLEQQQAQAQAIDRDASLSQEEKMSKVENLNNVTVSKINEELNDKQKREYADLREDLAVRSGVGQGSGNGSGHGPSDANANGGRWGRGQGIGQGATPDDQVGFLAAVVPLSSEQQSQIRTLLKDEHTQISGIYKDASLSQADKETRAHTVGEATVAKVRDLLNADQKKKFDERPQDMYEIIAKGGRLK